jgi:hypothetical protein
MGEGLKRAFAAARATRACPVKGCKRVKAKGGDICAHHQREWDQVVESLMKPKRHTVAE